MPALLPSQSVEALHNAAEVEVSTVSTVADTGAFEVTDLTFGPDVAGSLNSKYFTFYSALDGVKYYLWFNINSAGVDPMVAAATGVPITGATNVAAATLATSARAAIAALNSTNSFTTSGAGAHVIITNKALGASTDVADGAAATAFVISKTTDGAASNYQNKYFLLDDPDSHYAVWFNVSTLGVDPAVSGKTMVPVAISAGATAATIATALSAALDAHADFTSSVNGTLVTVKSLATGNTPNVTAGNAPVTLTSKRDGAASFLPAPGDSVSGLTNNPSAY